MIFFAAAKEVNTVLTKYFHDLYGGQPRIEGYVANHWKPVLNYLQDALRVIQRLLTTHISNRKRLCL